MILISILLALATSFAPSDPCNIPASSVALPNIPECPVGYTLDAECLLACETAFQNRVAKARSTTCRLNRNAERYKEQRVGQAAAKWLDCVAMTVNEAGQDLCETMYQATVTALEDWCAGEIAANNATLAAIETDAESAFIWCVFDCCLPPEKQKRGALHYLQQGQ